MEQSNGLLAWRRYWPLLAVILLAFFLVISTWLGWYFVRIGSNITITIYGGFLIARKVWQQSNALRYNLSVMLFRRQIVDELVKEIPEKRAFLTQIVGRHMRYDDFRAVIEEETGISESAWANLVYRSFQKHLSVGLVAPIYKLSTEEVEMLVRSVANQSYKVHACYLVINDANDIVMFDHLTRLVSEEFSDHVTRFEVIVEAKKGKREAMNNGFLRCLADGVDIVVNADGDTYLDEDAVASAVRLFEKRPEVVCMTGDVRVANANVNRLTLLTSLRYFYAFNVERAAQSLYGQMTCLSGPFLAIRAKHLALIRQAWYNQTFLGVSCTYGDDRHMTTLCLQEGWVSVYNPDVIVWTDSPVLVSDWRNQQRRWSRSGWRENYLLLKKGYERLHPFVQFDLFYLTFFPFLVLGVLIAVLINAVVTVFTVSVAASIVVVIPYAVSILLMSLVFQSLYGLILTGDRRFLFSTVYLYLWLRYLIFIKAKSLTELRDRSWITK